MTIDLNGKPHVVADGTSVTQLVLDHTGRSRGCAVVLDGEVLPRSAWDDTQVVPGQSIEIITAVQGG